MMKAVKLIKIFLLSVFVFSVNTGIANAQLITGGMGMTGSYTVDATTFTLGSATGTSGTDILGTTVGFPTPGNINNGAINFASFTSVANVLDIGGWQFDMDSLLNESTSSLWKFTGSGSLTDLNGVYENTAATYVLSANPTGSSYSISINATVVPVPAAVWLFGSGLLGLVGVARRKA